MLAVYYERQGTAAEVLCVSDLPPPVPQAGEVCVRVRASGINPSDVKIRAGLRGPMAFSRVIPHSDGSGVIESVGGGVDKARIGESVWLYNAAFGRSCGTAAEYICVPQALAVAFDASKLNFIAAATLGIPAQTAMAALLKGGDVSGKHVLVSGGAGAVGCYAIQFARHAGARVVATVSSEEKAETARAAGAHAVVNYTDAEAAAAILAATDGAGIDHLIELEFGGNLAITEAVMAAHSSLAVYGSERVREPVVPFYPFMFKNVSLHWLFVYALSDSQRAVVLEALRNYFADCELLTPIAATFAARDCVSAHEFVESGAKVGHVVLEFA